MPMCEGLHRRQGVALPSRWCNIWGETGLSKIPPCTSRPSHLHCSRTRAGSETRNWIFDVGNSLGFAAASVADNFTAAQSFPAVRGAATRSVAAGGALATRGFTADVAGKPRFFALASIAASLLAPEPRGFDGIRFRFKGTTCGGGGTTIGVGGGSTLRTSGAAASAAATAASSSLYAPPPLQRRHGSPLQIPAPHAIPHVPANGARPPDEAIHGSR